MECDFIFTPLAEFIKLVLVATMQVLVDILSTDATVGYREIHN